MPGGMEVFDASEHIGYSGANAGDSTGTGKKGSNSGTQKYKGHANGPKKVPSQRDPKKYYMYDTAKGFKQKLALEDMTDTRTSCPLTTAWKRHAERRGNNARRNGSIRLWGPLRGVQAEERLDR